MGLVLDLRLQLSKMDRLEWAFVGARLRNSALQWKVGTGMQNQAVVMFN